MKLTNYFRSTSLSSFVVYLTILVLAVNFSLSHAWKRSNVITGDTFCYYAYLPSFFIRYDVSLKFLDNDRVTPFNDLWYSTSGTGIRVSKVSMGWALMNLPFFLAAHLYAKASDYNADGFSLPYQYAICLATLFYVCLALWLLRKILLSYFSEVVVSLSLAVIMFATNLYYYTIFNPGMTHPINFFLFTCFLYLTVEWHKSATVKNSIFLGVVTGLIILTRPVNVLVVLVFILYGISGWKSLKEKIKSGQSNFFLLMLAAVSAFVLMLPQLAYWKLVSGNYYYYSYFDEHFFFDHPHIGEGLVGFRKGWLLYTPVMTFALAGLFLKSKKNDWANGLRVFMVLNIYILLSWWCWWYGGGFGGRSFIESYALLSIPLSGFFSQVISKRFIGVGVVILTLFFIPLNILQTYQYKHGGIHYDSMTKNAYIAVFPNRKKPDNFSSLLCHPDYVNAKLGLPERGDCVLHDHKNP